MENDILKWNWKTWQMLDAKCAEFVLLEGEKRLSQQINTAESLTKRPEAILRFAIPIGLGLVAFVIKSISDCSYGLAFYSAVYTTLGLIVVIILSFRAYWLYEIKPLGNTPQNMLTPDKLVSKNQHLHFLVTRIRSIQELIELNAKQNKDRNRKIDLIYKVTTLIIFVGIVMFLIYMISPILF
ncbi:MAG: hypothetical protein DHS20C17_28260 [Cyclobacteriaceae bacterium]|nr:MAG: hypothetical protein DHS20C17_28260 [Cyclobacteriaceae bacterium]